MRVRGLVLALVVLAALAGGIYWSVRAKKEQAAKPSPETPEILNIPADQFTRFELRRRDEEPVLLEKASNGRWEMTSGPKWPVDQDTAESIARTLSSLTASRLVEEKAENLEEFGLAKPAVELVFTTKDGKTRKLLIGDESPAGSGSFVKLEDDARVFIIAPYNKASLDRTARELRDKRLLTFDPDKLSRLELTAKGQTIEFGKNARNEWQIIRPRPLRADASTVEDLIRRLQDARMDIYTTEEDDKKAAAAFARTPLTALARVTDAAGTQQLEVRCDKDRNCYGKSSVVEGVHKVESYLADSMDKRLDDFRNKRLFDFGFSEPSSVEIRDGEKRAVYRKEPDRWMQDSTQVDASAVNTLVDRLRMLTATRFAESGFTTPVFEATVTSDSGKRVEKVLISRAGDRCYGRREGEPSIYELDPKSLEELQKAFADIRPYQPQQAGKEKKK